MLRWEIMLSRERQERGLCPGQGALSWPGGIAEFMERFVQLQRVPRGTVSGQSGAGDAAAAARSMPVGAADQVFTVWPCPGPSLFIYSLQPLPLWGSSHDESVSQVGEGPPG